MADLVFGIASGREIVRALVSQCQRLAYIDECCDEFDDSEAMKKIRVKGKAGLQ